MGPFAPSSPFTPHQLAVLDRFRSHYSSAILHHPSVSSPLVVQRVFHACPSMEIAVSICKSGFANLATTGNVYGAGIYFSLDLDYVLKNYGRVVIVCDVVWGHALPVMDTSSHRGRPLHGKFDAHVVVVSKNRPIKPILPHLWATVPTATHLVLPAFSPQILPRCVLDFS